MLFFLHWLTNFCVVGAILCTVRLILIHIATIMIPYHYSDFVDESSGLSVEVLSYIGLGLLLIVLIPGPSIQRTAKKMWSHTKRFVLQNVWVPLRKGLTATRLETRALSLSTLSDKLAYELQQRRFDLEIQDPLWYQKAEDELTDDEKELSEAIYEDLHNAGLTGVFDHDRAKLRELSARKLIEKLNKGYILHLHDNSMVSTEETLSVSVDHTWPWMRFSADAELKDGRLRTEGIIEFKIEKWNEETETQKINGGIFKANEWVQVRAFLDQIFKGNRKDGIKCISEHLVVHPTRYAQHYFSITLQILTVT